MNTNIAPYERVINDAVRAFPDKEFFAVEAGYAKQIVMANPAMQNQDMMRSLQDAVENIARIGITLNPARKLAYLVPRKGKVCLDISYMGLIRIATDSGSIKSVVSRVVYPDDEFSVTQGSKEEVVHKPKLWVNRNPKDDQNNICGVYCIATMSDGSTVHEIMSKAQIDAVKATSKAANGPWVSHYSEMARKTVVKRASKYWTTSDRMAEAVSMLHDTEGLEESVTHVKEEPTSSKASSINDMRNKVWKIILNESNIKGVEPKPYAQSLGIESIRSLTAIECNEFLNHRNALEAEVVE